MFNGPCKSECLAHATPARVGVVLGMGASLDDMSAAELAALKDPRVVSVGLNRVAVAKRFDKEGYFPDLYLIWGGPSRDPAVSECTASCLVRVTGRSWRVGIRHPENVGRGGFDQWLKPDAGDHWKGTLEHHGVRSRASCADGAVNLLYRMGVRTVVLYGVDLHGKYCRLPAQLPNQWLDPKVGVNQVPEWAGMLKECRDLSLFVASKRSLLAKSGTLKVKSLCDVLSNSKPAKEK